MTAESVPGALLIKHARAREILAIGRSAYWKLAREGKITIVGRGKAGRADFASIQAYYRELLAEARAEKAA